jgi:hypothetical protein
MASSLLLTGVRLKPFLSLVTSLVVALIGLGGVNLVFLQVSPKVLTTFPMLPDPIPYLESESLSLLRRFHFLVSFFLNVFSRFYAQLRIRLLCGIGFLSAFLSGAEIGFFRSVVLEPTAITSIVHRVCAPMLLAKVAVFLGTSFLWDSGCSFSTRSLCTLFLAVQSFLVVRSVRFLGSFLATYPLDSFERQNEQTHVHRSPTFLVKVELILPRVRARS